MFDKPFGPEEQRDKDGAENKLSREDKVGESITTCWTPNFEQADECVLKECCSATVLLDLSQEDFLGSEICVNVRKNTLKICVNTAGRFKINHS